MQLSADQLRDFDEQGYLFFPDCFSEEEIALLRDDAEAILKLDRQEVWREKSGAPRTAFAAHTFNEAFRLLGRASTPDPSRRAAVWRAGLHASVQDQREGRVRAATCGSGTRTTAPGRATTACRSRAR